MNIEKSLKAFSDAKEVIPGGVDSPVRAFSSVGGTPIFIKKGKASHLYDIDGNKYIDFVQSWGPLIHGHANKKIEKKVNKAIKKGLSFGAPTIVETKLAKKIVNLFDELDQVRFVSSGTEAVMSAIRVARGFTNRDDIVKFEGCYHGHSDSLLVEAGSGAVTFGTPSSPGVPADLTKHTLLAKYNDIESVKKCFEDSDNIACIIIEPIAGNMGLVPAKVEFLKELRTICDENNALLIFDEVMSGFRASLKGATGIVGVSPDILTFGKVIGAGMPVGAFGARDEIMNRLSPEGDIYQAGTLSGNPIAMNAGLKSLNMLLEDDKLYEKLEKKALRLTRGMKEAASLYDIPMQIDVRGSMFGFFFSQTPVTNFDDAKKSDAKLFASFHQGMLNEGVYFACSLYETGFICTTMSDKLIDSVIKKAKKVFKELS